MDITAASGGSICDCAQRVGWPFHECVGVARFHRSIGGSTKDGDAFLSWDEAFGAAKRRDDGSSMTIKRLSGVGDGDESFIEKEPANAGTGTSPCDCHRRISIGGGGGIVPPTRPDTTASTATLNFTSVPSGAKVVIDGCLPSGKTPLIGYEIGNRWKSHERDQGQSSKRPGRMKIASEQNFGVPEREAVLIMGV